MHPYKKKIICLFLIGLFISGSSIPHISGEYLNETTTQMNLSNDKTYCINYQLNFTKPIIYKQRETLKVEIKEANSSEKKSTDLKIPVYTKVVTLPFGSKVIDITCNHSEPEVIDFINTIDFKPYKNINANFFDRQKNEENNEWYECKTGGGLQDGNHVFIMKFTFYPLHYQKSVNKLLFSKNFEISIKYEKPVSSFIQNDEYDFLVISPNNFQKPLEKFVEHKNSHGINTKLVLLKDIYQDTYFSIEGNDKAEEIKLFIFNAFTEWGIDFVLLVGNINKMPIRKTWLGTGDYERTPLTDLYYADLCFGNGSFCSWNSNNNEYYGEVRHGAEDDLVDLYPDVYLGRLACNNLFELNTVINKIIQYENNVFGTEWYNNFILVGGDTHPTHNDYPEGEILIEEISKVTPSLNHIKLQTSDSSFSHDSLNNAINNGAGFFCYAGHGFEIGLSTHPPNSEEWINYNFNHIFGLKNKDKLPITFFNACLTARLDYNIVNLLADIVYFTSSLPKLNKRDDITFPVLFPCIAWKMVTYPQGGAIASIGATRISYGMIEESGDITGGCSYITVKFFEALSNSTYLSELLVSAKNDFLNNAIFKDPFIVEEMILLGDPTLKIGGYE